MSNKLYKVNIRVWWGEYYVVASSPDEAYKRVKADLEKRGVGHGKGRELKGVLLIAEDVEYPNCETRLYS